MASQQSFLMVVQLLLRAASIALSVAAIGVGLSVSAQSSIPWIMVFVAASVALLTSSIEFRPHLLQSCRFPRSSRLPPWVFIITDITAIGLVVYVVWGLVNYQGSGGKWENEKVAEVWVLVALGIIHLFCVLFDYFECCVLRERQQEIRRREEERDFWL